MSTWIQALKIFNKNGMWCMPRKGTAEHAKVLDIMKKIKSGDQKRITDSASSKEAPKPMRKLRTEKEKKEAQMMGMEDRDAPEMKVEKKGKEEICPTCGKSFKNLKQHIFKSHTKLHLTFKKVGEEYLLSAKTNDGKILATNSHPESEGDEGSEYFMGEHLVGWYVTLNKKKVKVRSSTIHPKSGTESSATAFKNWDVKFI
jgi:uncharacterized C2H2 Zn-finger protein